jgi:imidazole glycerol-phosphate synthase subunit HisH
LWRVSILSIAVVNTGISNIASVINALKYIGAKIIVTDNREELLRAGKIILPGVGSFSAGYDALKNRDLVDVIKSHAQIEKKPILGICLGMQLLASQSEEGGRNIGLDLISGNVERLKADMAGFRVPNIGWCEVAILKSNKLTNKLNSNFYHIHSYYFNCRDTGDIIGTIKFSGKDIPVIIQKDNVMGVQFHPEKSHESGLELLNQFIKY